MYISFFPRTTSPIRRTQESFRVELNNGKELSN